MALVALNLELVMLFWRLTSTTKLLIGIFKTIMDEDNESNSTSRGSGSSSSSGALNTDPS